jgi:hypothetical protein
VTEEEKKKESFDDTKRDQVLKRLLGTPPKPKPRPAQKPEKQRGGRGSK